MTITEFILFMHPLWVLRLLFAALLVRGCKHCLNAAAAVKKKRLAAHRSLHGKWRKTTGVVRRLGHLLDYAIPPDEANETQWNAHSEQVLRNIASDRRHGGLFIGYEYKWNGETLRSREMAPYAGRIWGRPMHIDLLYKLHIGKPVTVWVDSMRPKRSFLRMLSKADVERLGRIDLAQALWRPAMNAALAGTALALTFLI